MKRDTLNRAEIESMATRARIAGMDVTDGDGNPKEGIEHHPDIIVASVKLELVEPVSPDRYGYDDTDEFYLAQGAVYPGDAT